MYKYYKTRASEVKIMRLNVDGERNWSISGSETVLGKGAQETVWEADKGMKVGE